jgi:hypothetical protein
MLQCPNCKEYCITYLDTFGTRYNSIEVCKKCGGLYTFAGFDVFKRIFFPLLGSFLLMYILISFLPNTSKSYVILLCMITLFLIDYLLYKTSPQLKTYEASKEELGIINVDKNEFETLLVKLSNAKKNSFISILENESYKRYLEITYANKNYKLSLSLTTKENIEIEDKFSNISVNLGYTVTKHSNEDVDFLEISISEISADASVKLQEFIKRIFDLNKVEKFIVVPDLD